MTDPMSEAGQTCVQLPGHHAYTCIIPEGFLYWSNWAYVNHFYWHPSVAGNYVVNWTYYKDSAPGYAGGPQYTKRVWSVATGVVVTEWEITVADTAPAPPTTGVDWLSGAERALTALEQASLLNAWKAAQNVPGNDW